MLARKALVPALLLLGLPGAAPAAAAPADAARRQKVAVLELRAIGVAKGDADLLSEVAATEASRFASLEVIGQSEVAALLGLERQKQLLGCKEDWACMAEIGGALGADLVLIGTIGKIGDLRRVDLRVVDVRRVRVLGRTGETLEGKVDLLVGAVQRGVRELLGPIAGAATPGPSAVAALPAVAAAAAPAPALGTPAGSTPYPRPGFVPRQRAVTIRAGEEIMVFSHRNWLRGCLPAPPPEVRFVVLPQQGKAETRPGDYVVPDQLWGRADSPCKGKVLPGLGVFYRAPQAPGKDGFRYQLLGSGASRKGYDVLVEITVK